MVLPSIVLLAVSLHSLSTSAGLSLLLLAICTVGKVEEDQRQYHIYQGEFDARCTIVLPESKLPFTGTGCHTFTWTTPLQWSTWIMLWLAMSMMTVTVLSSYMYCAKRKPKEMTPSMRSYALPPQLPKGEGSTSGPAASGEVKPPEAAPPPSAGK